MAAQRGGGTGGRHALALLAAPTCPRRAAPAHRYWPDEEVIAAQYVPPKVVRLDG